MSSSVDIWGHNRPHDSQNYDVVSLAPVMAIGVAHEGGRGLLGFDLGAREEEALRNPCANCMSQTSAGWLSQPR